MSTEFDFRTIISSQTSIMGDLRQLLSQGEYAPFTSSPMFESKFVQVKKIIQMKSFCMLKIKLIK